MLWRTLHPIWIVTLVTALAGAGMVVLVGFDVVAAYLGMCVLVISAPIALILAARYSRPLSPEAADLRAVRQRIRRTSRWGWLFAAFTALLWLAAIMDFQVQLGSRGETLYLYLASLTPLTGLLLLLRYLSERRTLDRLLSAEPRCVSCGYLLRGLPEPRCPECGTAFTAEAPIPHDPGGTGNALPGTQRASER